MRPVEYCGKYVRVTITNGKAFEGYVDSYVSAVDNEPNPEAIILDEGIPHLLTELYIHQITSI